MNAKTKNFGCHELESLNMTRERDTKKTLHRYSHMTAFIKRSISNKLTGYKSTDFKWQKEMRVYAGTCHRQTVLWVKISLSYAIAIINAESIVFCVNIDFI